MRPAYLVEYAPQLARDHPIDCGLKLKTRCLPAVLFSEKLMPNRLQFESSPYLLQHAHNPVDWYPWGEEAFERARLEDKPILVSIGYSTCHWCHVMEKESFEDEAVAQLMNELFINIKVDREERPDVDHIYMEACQAISGSGGWPLNCFLLPDRRPFYAGTYYPPQPAYNRPGWPQLLRHLSGAYHDKREDVVGQAAQLMDMISRSDQTFTQRDDRLALPNGQVFHAAAMYNLFHTLQQRFDLEEGGFGGAPKFPGAMSLAFMLDYHHYTGQPDALSHLHFSLQRMIGGGIYDQLGGGFARYATDRAWLIPHFEKMLYDNALLVRLMSRVQRYDPRPEYAEAITQTLDFINRELRSAQGGFYSALDADSEGVEGKFYVWDQTEIEEILQDDAPVFNYIYGVQWDGNWEEVNILWRKHSLQEAADKYGLSLAYVERLLARARQTLLAHRASRVRPGLDDKVLLDWNALMITAFAAAHQALGREEDKQTAISQLEFVLQNMASPDGGMYHAYKDGIAKHDAFLDDYAFLIEALLEIYDITFNPHYLDQSATFMAYVLEHFLDNTDGLFYFTDAKQKDVLVRRKELYDSATPSGNATMAHNLLKLGVLLGKPDWEALADRMLKVMAQSVERYPTSFSRWARALLYRAYPGQEVAVVGPQAISTAQRLNARYTPNTVVMAAETAGLAYPLLEGRPPTDRTLIYVCRQYACQLPVEHIEDARALLASPAQK